MSSFGLQTLQTVGNAIQLIASDLSNVRWKVAGITFDWSTVAAVSGADVTLTNGTVVKIGQKYIPMGEIVAKITANGQYAVHRTTNTDGSQTLARSYCFLVNEDVVETAVGGAWTTGAPSAHPPVFDGGTIWRARLKIGGSGQATLAQFVAAFPLIDFADV